MHFKICHLFQPEWEEKTPPSHYFSTQCFYFPTCSSVSRTRCQISHDHCASCLNEAVTVTDRWSCIPRLKGASDLRFLSVYLCVVPPSSPPPVDAFIIQSCNIWPALTALNPRLVYLKRRKVADGGFPHWGSPLGVSVSAVRPCRRSCPGSDPITVTAMDSCCTCNLLRTWTNFNGLLLLCSCVLLFVAAGWCHS